MALISEIRKRSGLVLGLIGLALVGFIVMDATQNSSLGGGKRSNDIASVAGTSISIDDFNSSNNVLYPNADNENVFQNRAQVYNFLVNNALIEKEVAGLGLGVSATELSEAEFGDQPHGLIGNLLGQQMNRESLNQLKTMVTGNQMQPEFKPIWAKTEQLIKADLVQQKVQNLIEKSIYVPKWMAEASMTDQAALVDINFVRVPFDKIPDTEAAVTDADLTTYLSENATRYESEEATRKIAYVNFEVIPSAQDSLEAFNKLNGLLTEFNTTQNDSAFVLTNGGFINGQYLGAAALPPAVLAAVGNLNIGGVAGPFFDEKSYNLVKVIDRTTLPDSVQVRHILINVNEQRTDAVAKQMADSLLNVIQSTGGATFGQIAAQYSDDPGSKNNGGEYTFSYSANLYPEFYNYAFKSGRPGAYEIVKTQAGGYHIMNVMSYKGQPVQTYKLASLREPIAPSKATEQLASDAAAAVLSQSADLTALEKNAKNKGLNVQLTPNVRGGDFNLGTLGQGQTQREMVRWAFEKNTKLGLVAPTVYEIADARDLYPVRFVIAALKATRAQGPANLADVREEIEPVVRNKKKGRMIAEKIKAADLAAVAGQFTAVVDTAVGLSFATSFNAKLGNEPRVVAAAFAQKVGETSKPIIGEGGVFLIRPFNKPAAEAGLQVDMMRQQLMYNQRQQISSGAVRSMRKASKIEDLRNTFPNL